MPRFNQQGPMGEGPMTGRKMGKCTNYGENSGSVEEQVNENGGRRGRGFGMRRGRCADQGRGGRGFVENESQECGKDAAQEEARAVQDKAEEE